MLLKELSKLSESDDVIANLTSDSEKDSVTENDTSEDLRNSKEFDSVMASLEDALDIIKHDFSHINTPWVMGGSFRQAADKLESVIREFQRIRDGYEE